MLERLRARAGRSLESGATPTLLRRAAASLWGAVASRGVRRPLVLPPGALTIGVGSAVLGGAGKTPIAVALARELARSGARVALVSHAYRASPRRAREVWPSDPPGEVGDDALASARLLAEDGVPVFVAPARQAAVDRARAWGAEVLILDGLLQAAPERLTDSILVLDALSPWGSGQCPPLGDLRAPREALLASSDHVLLVRALATATAGTLSPVASAPPGAIEVTSAIHGAKDASGRRWDLASLRQLRVGLLVAVARPDRILRALALCGVEPTAVIALADHAAPTRAELAAAIAVARRGAACPEPPDAWLTTARCATKLPANLDGAPVLALDHRIDIAPLLSGLRSLQRVAPCASLPAHEGIRTALDDDCRRRARDRAPRGRRLQRFRLREDGQD